MRTDSAPSPEGRSWTLLLAPGARLEECFPVLEALVERGPEPHEVEIERLPEWLDLFCTFPERGRMVVESKSVTSEQADLLRAFLRRHTGWELLLVGGGGDAELVAELAARPGTRWWPGALEPRVLTGWLVAPGHEAAPAQPAPAPRSGPERAVRAPRRPAAAEPVDLPPVEEDPTELVPFQPESRRTDGEQAGAPADLDPEDEGALLEQIERILAGGEDAAPVTPAKAPAEGEGEAEAEEQQPHPVGLSLAVEEPPLEREQPAPVAEPAPSSTPEVVEHPTPRRPHPPAPYFGRQVADLADLVQIVDLSLAVTRRELADGPGAPGRLEENLHELGSEVARLRQFARTLNFLVAPPALGDQRLDLGPLLEEMLTARRSEGGSPRYLLRAPDPLPVRSDKLLLTQALDALLFLAHHAAGPEGTVRVDASTLESPEEEQEHRLSIRFPAGRFTGQEPGLLIEPYGIRSELPELGPNALAAACSLLQGQGGSVELRTEQGGAGFEWIVRLPGAR